MKEAMKLSKVYKVSSFEEAKKLCPKGYRMLEIWELVKLACEKNKSIFETEKGSWIWFLSKTQEGHFIRRLYRLRGGDWGAGWDGSLGDFNEPCRVIFMKEEIKKHAKMEDEILGSEGAYGRN
ncbi:MAG: hypothetical protein KKD18_06655 [Nanoarchaeota archaeon]|nr:hypothetical protein [Nanoarchaeota archaeon]